MRTIHYVTACFLAMTLAPTCAPAMAADLSEIERTVDREPEYQTDSPRYCLLVFGPQAATRVWLVRDGRTVFVDRNGNGDLTDPGERVDLANEHSRSVDLGDIVELGRGVTHTKLYISWTSNGTPRIRVTLHGNRMQFVGRDRAKKLRFAEEPGNAPIIHFDGPLTLARYSTPVTLARGISRSRLRLMVGTQGLGEGTFAGFHHRCTVDHGPLIADIEYPSQQSGAGPIKTTLALKTKS